MIKVRFDEYESSTTFDSKYVAFCEDELNITEENKQSWAFGLIYRKTDQRKR